MSPADLEKRREYDREYARKRYYANPEQSRERARKWREENPEYIRRWREANREGQREYGRKRRAAMVTQDKRDLNIATQRRRTVILERCASKVQVVGAWSEAEESTVVRLRAQGWTYEQVALVLGRTYSSVKKRISKMRMSGVLVA